jgi:hypothetical protein
MAVERLFDDHRIDVMAAADDEILGTAGQPDIALGVEPAEITGVEPAAGQHGTAVMARIEITRGDLRAAHQHVADRAGRAIAADRAVGRHVGDADLGVGQAQADRSGAALAMQRVHARVAVHLGHAVALDHRGTDLALDAPDQLDGHGRATGLAG